jgi:hypothetical protein
MRWIATRKEHQNGAAADPWTVVHLAAGLASGLVGWSFTTSMSLAVAYEVVEQVVERTPQGRHFFKSSRPENALNAITDLAAFALGHRLGRVWNEPPRRRRR